MSDPIEDLIQRVLEGDATAEERTRLESRLAADPVARVRHEELSRAFEALRAVRLEEPPAGMRDEVLRAVRGAAPAWAQASARAGRASNGGRAAIVSRPAFPWLRLALPVAAGAVAALVLFASWQGGPLRTVGDRTSGTMTQLRPDQGLALGSGDDAVHVTWSDTETGFRIHLRTSDAPVRVALDVLTPGALLTLAPAVPTPSPRIEATLPANALVVAEGTGPSHRASVRVSVTLPDGHVATGEIGPRGARSPR